MWPGELPLPLPGEGRVEGGATRLNRVVQSGSPGYPHPTLSRQRERATVRLGVSIAAGISRRVGRRLFVVRSGAVRRRRGDVRADARAARGPGGVLRVRPKRWKGGDRGDPAQDGARTGSIPVQLARYLADVATGNLGNSLTTGQPVTQDMARRAARLPGTDLHRAGDRAAAVPAARRRGGVAAGLAPRPCRADAVHARRVRAHLRVRTAADLRVLLPARLGARPDRADRHLRLRTARHHRVLPGGFRPHRRLARVVGKRSPNCCCRHVRWRCSCWRRWRA